MREEKNSLRRRITARREYIDELLPVHALHVALVRCSRPGVEVRNVAVQSSSDLVEVVGPDEVPSSPFRSAALPPDVNDQVEADTFILNARPRFLGEPVAAVVAKTEESARALARGAIISYGKQDVSNLTCNVLNAYRSGDHTHSVVAQDWLDEVRGDEERSDVLRVSATFNLARVSAVCLDSHGCFATPDGHGVHVRTNTQAPREVQGVVAQVLNLEKTRVRVTKVLEGGGFGSKQEIYEEPLVAFLALRYGAAVAIKYSRHEELAVARARGHTILRTSLSMSSRGDLEELRLDALLDSGGLASHSPHVLTCLAGHAQAAYPRLRQRFRAAAVRTHRAPAGAMRGYGVAESAFAIEQLIDRLCVRHDLDPLEVRLRNVRPKGQAERALMLFGNVNDIPRAPITLGVKHSITQLDEKSPVRVELTGEDECTIYTGTCDSGTGSSTGLLAIAREVIGGRITEIRLREGDTRDGHVDLGSSSQRSTFVGGQAVAQACKELAAWLDARPHRELTPGKAFSSSVPTKGIGVSAVVARVSVNHSSDSGDIVPASVDAAVSCGRVLSTDRARGQIIGGLSQGLSQALFEEAEGAYSIRDHGVLGALDVPSYNVAFAAAKEHQLPHGVGELGIVPAAAAIAVTARRAGICSGNSMPLLPRFR